MKLIYNSGHRWDWRYVPCKISFGAAIHVFPSSSRGKGTETIIQRHVWFPPDDPSSVGGWTNILLYISFGLLSVKACTVLMHSAGLFFY